MEYNAKNKAKILIVDDHPIVRQGAALMINREPELQVCHEAETAKQALEMNQACPHDLAIIDLSLADSSGLELVKQMLGLFPKLPILVMSMHDEAIYAERVLRAGARGYLMKQEATDTMLQAVRKILRGALYVSERMHEQMLHQQINGNNHTSPTSGLTSTEFEILHLIGMGLNASDIAVKLKRSVKTIDSHRANIKKKLKLDSSSDLAHYAFKLVNSMDNQ